MKIKTTPSGFEIDLRKIFRGISNHKINFEIVHMEKFRIKEWVTFTSVFQRNNRDLTKNIILIDGIGLVDGFFMLSRTRNDYTLMPALFLQLRNVIHCVDDLLFANKKRLKQIMNTSDFSEGVPCYFDNKFFKDLYLP